MAGTLNFDILLRDHIDGYRRLGWNGWCENLKPIVTYLKKLSPKNRASRGLKSIVDWLSAPQFVSFYSIVTTGQPHALRSALAYNRERVGRNTRQSDNLSMPRVKNNHGKRRFMHRTVKKYNELVITPGRVKANCNWFKEHSGECPTWLVYTTVGPRQKWTSHRSDYQSIKSM